MSVEIDMSEVDDLAADLAIAGPRAERVSDLALTVVANQLANDARSAVAVDSGATRGSIHVEPDEDSRLVIADDEAAFYLEFGTSDTAPQPFMWPQAATAGRRLEVILGRVDPLKPTLT